MLSSVRSQQTSPALAVRKSLEPEVDFAGGRWTSPLAAEAGTASAPLRLPSQGCADGAVMGLASKMASACGHKASVSESPRGVVGSSFLGRVPHLVNPTPRRSTGVRIP